MLVEVIRPVIMEIAGWSPHGKNTGAGRNCNLSFKRSPRSAT